ncbi:MULTISPECIES: DUF4762 family protein [Providencia]|uniref:DUF4762 family protein n=1 Tax=Providencia TaxID=586 RepID=UPI00300D5882
MKKLNAVEAGNIIGGTSKVCSDSYERIVSGGVATCRVVTTCTDKHGKKTYQYANTNLANCPGVIEP